MTGIQALNTNESIESVIGRVPYLVGNAQSIVIPVKTGVQFYLVRIGREVEMLEEWLPWA